MVHYPDGEKSDIRMGDHSLIVAQILRKCNNTAIKIVRFCKKIAF